MELNKTMALIVLPVEMRVDTLVELKKKFYFYVLVCEYFKIIINAYIFIAATI